MSTPSRAETKLVKMRSSTGEVSVPLSLALPAETELKLSAEIEESFADHSSKQQSLIVG